MANTSEDKTQTTAVQAPVPTTAAAPIQVPTVVPSPADAPQESDPAIEAAKELKNKSDEELKAAQKKLKDALDAIPDVAGGFFDKAREAVQANIDLVQAEMEKRANQTKKDVDAALTVAGEDAQGFWSQHGNEVNEAAKWIVLAAIVYRLFIF